MRNRADLLESLQSPDACAELCSLLSESANALDGSGIAGDPSAPPEVRVKVAFQLAARLRDVAQRLCDHCRESGDGRCRYCRTLMSVDSS